MTLPDPRPSSPLRDWLKQQGITVSEFAKRLGRPQGTVEDWAYRGRVPSPANSALLYVVTGIPEFQPRSRVPERVSKPTQLRSTDMPPSQISRLVEFLVKELRVHLQMTEEILELSRRLPLSVRERMRARLNPSSIARLSALLRAILAEDRLREFEIADKVSNSLRTTHREAGYGADRKS